MFHLAAGVQILTTRSGVPFLLAALAGKTPPHVAENARRYSSVRRASDIDDKGVSVSAVASPGLNLKAIDFKERNYEQTG